MFIISRHKSKSFFLHGCRQEKIFIVQSGAIFLVLPKEQPRSISNAAGQFQQEEPIQKFYIILPVCFQGASQ